MNDHDAELPELVANHIEWLRRPFPVPHGDQLSADYLERLLGVAHRLAERAETADAEATKWRLLAETLAAADTPLTALEPFGIAPGNFLTYTHGDGTTCEVAQIVCAPVLEALRALVAPDPTSPTDTGDPT